MLNPEVTAAYQQSRDCADKSVLCHAPFANLYFNQMGQGIACCYNHKQVLGTYPGDSIEDMWFGESATRLREAIGQGDLGLGCQICEHQLNSGNFAGHITTFDRYGSEDGARSVSADPGPPLGMEFSLSNTCSLECVMCNGALSSRIRQREGLPAIANPYGEEFVAQLERFVPTLKVAKFYGGEPFLIETYYAIWELFERLNPDIEIEITSSAAVIPPRARERLEGLRCRVIVSLDSLTEQVYEDIRQNASFGQVMDNFEYLLGYAATGRGAVSLTVCPMQQNWREMPDIVRFANDKGVAVGFNTVYEPLRCSLRTLGQKDLDAILEEWRSADLPSSTTREQDNLRRFEGVINQVVRWRDERAEAEASSTLISGTAFSEGADPQTDMIAFLTRLISEGADMKRRGLEVRSFDAATAALRQAAATSIQSYLEVLDVGTFFRCFLDTLSRCYPEAYELSEAEAASFRRKIHTIFQILEAHPHREAFAPYLVSQDIRLMADWIRGQDEDGIVDVIRNLQEGQRRGAPSGGRE